MAYSDIKNEKEKKLSNFKNSYVKTLDVNAVKVQSVRARSEFTQELSHWQKIVLELYPAHYLVDNIKNTKVIATDIINSVEQSVNEIMSTFFYPMLERVSIEIANDYFAMKQTENDDKFIQKLSQAISRAIADEKNNFARIQKQILLDYIILGNVAIQQKYDEERRCFRYYQIPIDTVYIRTDFNKNLQHVFREYNLSWFEVLEYFTEDEQNQIKSVGNVMDLEKELHNKRFAFIEFYEYDKISDLWYCTIVYKFGGNEEVSRIRITEYDYQPILYVRYNLSPNTHYGKTILQNYLASIVVFNLNSRLLETAKQRALLPPLIVANGAFEKDIDFSADAINQVKEEFIGKAIAQPLTQISNLNAIFPLLQVNSQNVGQILGINTLVHANKDDKGEYAPVTTVNYAQDIAKISQIPIYQALEDQLMKPMIEAHLKRFLDDILEEASEDQQEEIENGMEVENDYEDKKEDKKNKEDKQESFYKLTHDGIRIPDELIDYYKKDSKKIKIEYKSGITDILEQVGIKKEMNALGFISNLINIAPNEVGYFMNLEAMVQVFRKASGYPQLIRSAEEIDKLKQEAQQKQEQLQQQQMQMQMAQIQQKQQ